MYTFIEWTVDFIDFFKLPLAIGALWLVGKKLDKKRARKNNRRQSGNGYTYQSHDDDYGHQNYAPSNDPDFSYMNPDDSDESHQKDYLHEAYEYGDQISPFNPDDQAAYQQMDEHNKNY